MPYKFSFSDLSSALAIGSLTFLGLFFIADHFMNLWTFFEDYAGNQMWGIIIAIPSLVTIYTIGLLNLNLSNVLFDKIYGIKSVAKIKTFITISETNNDSLIQKFIELENLQNFFQACSLSFLILGLGSFGTAKWMAGYEFFSYLFGLSIILIALVCPLIAKSYSNKLRFIIEHVEKGNNT